jgi:hypothetical protein
MTGEEPLPRLRPSPALVVACLALAVSLGGTSYAAITLPKNSVGTKQLKKNAVISTKVKNGSLLRADFRSGQIPAGPQGPPGQQGAQGIQGSQGPQGPAGPTASNATANSSTPGASPVLTATTIYQPELGRLAMWGGSSASSFGCLTAPCSLSISLFLDGTFVSGSRRTWTFAGSGNSTVMSTFAQAGNVAVGLHTVQVRYDLGGVVSGGLGDFNAAAIALGPKTTTAAPAPAPSSSGSIRIGS